MKNGFLVIDKEKDLTSRDVDNQVQKIFEMKKVGHLGTLDPLATGVLAVAIGQATKFIPFIEKTNKTYLVEVKQGVFTDTLDITGKILKTSSKRLTAEEIKKLLSSLDLVLNLEVPLYSAVKVEGKKLYQYARAQEDVKLPVKEMKIINLKFIDAQEDYFSFEIEVSFGTYIRSIVGELSKRSQIPMTMSNLRRTKSGNFNLDSAIKIKDLDSSTKLLNPIDFIRLDKIEVSSELKELISHGAILDNIYSKLPVAFVYENKIIAIYDCYLKDKNKIKALKVFI